MAEFQLTNKAVQDLNEIWLFTFEEWDEKQADSYYHQLLEACQDAANTPEIGKKYSEIYTDLFGLKVIRHIVFYRIISPSKIEITRILHERMDLKNRL